MLSLKKSQIIYILLIYIFIPLRPLAAFEIRDYSKINMLVKSCYKDAKSCNGALSHIHNLQKNASIKKKFSCQTRLLGLEANLIMAANSNFKRKEAKSIIEDVRKYC